MMAYCFAAIAMDVGEALCINGHIRPEDNLERMSALKRLDKEIEALIR